MSRQGKKVIDNWEDIDESELASSSSGSTQSSRHAHATPLSQEPAPTVANNGQDDSTPMHAQKPESDTQDVLNAKWKTQAPTMAFHDHLGFQPKLKILKRTDTEASQPKSVAPSMPTSASTPPLSLEEKRLRYEEARQKIFGTPNNTPNPSSPHAPNHRR